MIAALAITQVTSNLDTTAPRRSTRTPPRRRRARRRRCATRSPTCVPQPMRPDGSSREGTSRSPCPTMCMPGSPRRSKTAPPRPRTRMASSRRTSCRWYEARLVLGAVRRHVGTGRATPRRRCPRRRARGRLDRYRRRTGDGDRERSGCRSPPRRGRARVRRRSSLGAHRNRDRPARRGRGGDGRDGGG